MAQRRLNHQKLADVFHRHQPHHLTVVNDGHCVAIAFLHEDLDIVDAPQGLARRNQQALEVLFNRLLDVERHDGQRAILRQQDIGCLNVHIALSEPVRWRL